MDSRPLCKYGRSCFRKNPDHLAKFSHKFPPLPAAAASTAAPTPPTSSCTTLSLSSPTKRKVGSPTRSKLSTPPRLLRRPSLLFTLSPSSQSLEDSAFGRDTKSHNREGDTEEDNDEDEYTSDDSARKKKSRKRPPPPRPRVVVDASSSAKRGGKGASRIDSDSDNDNDSDGGGGGGSGAIFGSGGGGDSGKSAISGKTVCFSGGLAGMVRRVCKEKALNLGAFVSDTLTKKVDILFIGDTPGSKLDRARDLGIKVMTEDDFKAILEGSFTEGPTPKKLKSVSTTTEPIPVWKTASKIPVKSTPAKESGESSEDELEDFHPQTSTTTTTATITVVHTDSTPLNPPRIQTTTIPSSSTSNSSQQNNKPPCFYGASCYRKNLSHFEKYSHPPMAGGIPGMKNPENSNAKEPSVPVPTTHILPRKQVMEETEAHSPSATESDVNIEHEKETADEAKSRPKALHELTPGQIVDIQSSTSSTVYQIKRVGDHYYCTCQAWKNQNAPVDSRSCKHLHDYLGDAFEKWRMGPDAGSYKRPVAKVNRTIPELLLAHKWEESQDPTGWWMSEKLDGVRAFWNGQCFLSRLGNVFAAPNWYVQGLPSDLCLDGELWCGRGKFQEAVSIVKTMNSPQWPSVSYQVFDAPMVDNGKAPFEERIERAKKALAAGNPQHATVIEHKMCKGKAHLMAELKRIQSFGGEGVMLRKPGSHYVQGRSTTLLKVKTFHDAEAKVLGYEDGKGKHKGRVGALQVEFPNGKHFKIGTGLSDRDREHPPPIGSFVTFRYQELTPDGIPRFPAFVSQRHDMDQASFTKQLIHP
ncbi:DNA ligase [Pelomyxa schiedti]|nr:DNA ligase [Pelomyxa schiedti]